MHSIAESEGDEAKVSEPLMETNWDDLKFLLAVADHGTLSAAADGLGSTVTTVSRRVKRLEEEIGCVLIERSGEGWRATAMAEGLIATARTMRAAMTAAEYSLARGARDVSGQVLISSKPFVNTLALVPAVPAFLAANPTLELQIDYTTKAFSLARGEADLALQFTEPCEGRLVRRKLATYHTGIYRPRGATPEPHWLGLSRSLEGNPFMLHAQKHLAGVPVARFHSLFSLAEAMRLCGLAGPLTTCVAALHDDLEPIHPLADFSEGHIWLVYHESRRNDPRIERVISWLEAVFPNPRRCVCGKCA
jgi:DNA-binding transcriptional LysR family regulator